MTSVEPAVKGGMRRAAAVFAASALLLVLAWEAWDSVAPLPASLSVMRKFWRAGSATRILNSRLFRRSPELGIALVQRGPLLPPGADVVLTVPPGLPDAEAEEMRRKTAFMLAPRRVTLARGVTGHDGFLLAATPPVRRRAP